METDEQIIRACVPPPLLPPPGNGRDELALFVPRKWTDRTELHVRFLDGDPALWGRVAAAVVGDDGWNVQTSMQFVFDQAEDSEIRVTSRGGSWSYEGAYALGIPAEEPTMQLGWLTMDTTDEEVGRVVKHEFGHALGMVHEHASPEAHIPWDAPALYAYYRKQGWSKDMVDGQIIWPIAPEVALAGPYDTESIMHYLIPKEFVLDGIARGGGLVLSEEDKRMVREMYGPPPAAPWKPPI